MAEKATLAEAVTAFEQIDGIEANSTDLEWNDRMLVKVMDEHAVGEFFKVCRQLDLSRESTSRNDLSDTVLDSWVSVDE